MDEAVIFQRRNRLKKHYVNTSNVLLYGYFTVSDAAKITYQVIDGFDWEDKDTGDSKGYVFPAVETLANIRNTSIRTIQRHIKELEAVNLLTRQRRRNKPSILFIEDVSDGEVKEYTERFIDKANSPEIKTFRNDKNVVSHEPLETTKMSFAYKCKKDELKENKINVNENLKTVEAEKEDKRGEGIKSLKDLLIQYELKIPLRRKALLITKQIKRKETKKQAQNGGKDFYLAQEMAEKLNDQKSLACYRTIAQKVPETVIFEVLSSIKETARDGKIKKSRGALFVNIIQSYCDNHGIELGFSGVI